MTSLLNLLAINQAVKLYGTSKTASCYIPLTFFSFESFIGQPEELNENAILHGNLTILEIKL